MIPAAEVQRSAMRAVDSRVPWARAAQLTVPPLALAHTEDVGISGVRPGQVLYACLGPDANVLLRNVISISAEAVAGAARVRIGFGAATTGTVTVNIFGVP